MKNHFISEAGVGGGLRRPQHDDRPVHGVPLLQHAASSSSGPMAAAGPEKPDRREALPVAERRGLASVEGAHRERSGGGLREGDDRER